MAKTYNRLVAQVAGALSNIFKPTRRNKGVTHGNTTGTLVGNNPFGAFWLYLKGAPGKVHPGMTELPQWLWPDKDQYGQAKDGSVRRRTPKTPFRVRRWRKRAAAKIAKTQGHTLDYAKQIVKNMEAGIVRNMIDAQQDKN